MLIELKEIYNFKVFEAVGLKPVSVSFCDRTYSASEAEGRMAHIYSAFIREDSQGR
ncbi:MAG: hypothetical protein QXO02_08655 [Thermofilaceae archaeon]